MANSTYNKFQCLVEDLAEKKHNLASDTLKVALTNSAPAATMTKLSELTGAIAAPALDSVTLSVSSSSQTSGTYKLVLADKTMTATGAVGPFRYVAIYNDTAANKELICYFDYGTAVTLASGDTFKLDFGTELFSLA